MGALATPRLTVKEYLDLDRAAERKSEYHDGELFPIVAATFNHGHLQGKAFKVLDACLGGGGCVGSISSRIRVSPTQFVYPDLVVVCGRPQFTDEETNPKLIVEVLSPSTAD